MNQRRRGTGLDKSWISPRHLRSPDRFLAVRVSRADTARPHHDFQTATEAAKWANAEIGRYSILNFSKRTPSVFPVALKTVGDYDTIPPMFHNAIRSVIRRLLTPILKYALETHLVVGNAGKTNVGERVALANAILNVSSGSITLGERTILSHGVMIITGRHDFIDGKRASFPEERDDGSWGGGEIEVPASGFDITLGEGVWVGVGAIILGGVNVGSHSIVAAGAVVTKDFPEHSVIAGIPARRIGDTRDRRKQKN